MGATAMFDKMSGKLVSLDNGRHYQIIWSKEMEGRRFLYLLNQDDFSEPLFCEKISDTCLKEIEDEALLKRVILSMTKEIYTFVMR